MTPTPIIFGGELVDLNGGADFYAADVKLSGWPMWWRKRRMRELLSWFVPWQFLAAVRPSALVLPGQLHCLSWPNRFKLLVNIFKKDTT